MSSYQPAFIVVVSLIVVVSVITLDRLKIDDPVGAISVHLVCGIWGTLAVGLFGAQAGLGQLGIQALGVGAVALFAFLFAAGTFTALRATVGIRVSPEEEVSGLDVFEHGYLAYPYFAEMDALEGAESTRISAATYLPPSEIAKLATRPGSPT